MKPMITIAAHRGKIHHPWAAIGWRTRCRKFYASLSGLPGPFRTIDEFKEVYNRRICAVLQRNLSVGCAVVERADWPEDRQIRWWVGKPGTFIPEYNTAEHIAKHITCRALGFGWSIALH